MSVVLWLQVGQLVCAVVAVYALVNLVLALRRTARLLNDTRQQLEKFTRAAIELQEIGADLQAIQAGIVQRLEDKR